LAMWRSSPITYQQECWEPSPSDIYHSAIYEEGKLTLSVVTKHLYKGDTMGPDLYFKSKYGEEKYKKVFKRPQQLTLERYIGEFDIDTAVKNYDISLHYLLQEYLCGLSQKGSMQWQMKGTLENQLSKVHTIRNNVTHQTLDMSEHVLRDKLIELAELYGDILNYVSSRTHHSIVHDRLRIMNSLNEKLPLNSNGLGYYERKQSSGLQNMNRMVNRYSSDSYDVAHCDQSQGESSGLQTLGKIALGVAGAAAVIGGVAALVKNDKDNEKKKERSRSSKEDECSVM
ncbi:unnamed protein product, partial [Meganyctiphanes norvegica]